MSVDYKRLAEIDKQISQRVPSGSTSYFCYNYFKTNYYFLGCYNNNARFWINAKDNDKFPLNSKTDHIFPDKYSYHSYLKDIDKNYNQIISNSENYINKSLARIPQRSNYLNLKREEFESKEQYYSRIKEEDHKVKQKYINCNKEIKLKLKDWKSTWVNFHDYFKSELEKDKNTIIYLTGTDSPKYSFDDQILTICINSNYLGKFGDAEGGPIIKPKLLRFNVINSIAEDVVTNIRDKKSYELKVSFHKIKFPKHFKKSGNYYKVDEKKYKCELTIKEATLKDKITNQYFLYQS